MVSVAEVQRQAKRHAGDAGGGVSDQITAIADYLEDLTHSLGRSGRRQAKRTRKQTRAAAHEADAFVRHNPYAIIGAALTLGVLCGLLFGRR